MGVVCWSALPNSRRSIGASSKTKSHRPRASQGHDVNSQVCRAHWAFGPSIDLLWFDYSGPTRPVTIRFYQSLPLNHLYPNYETGRRGFASERPDNCFRHAHHFASPNLTSTPNFFNFLLFTFCLHCLKSFLSTFLGPEWVNFNDKFLEVN